jgi:hypothetical protein
MTTTPLRIVTSILGLVLVIAVVGIIYLATTDHTIPDVLQNIAVGSMTALGALLVPSRSNPSV